MAGLDIGPIKRVSFTENTIDTHVLVAAVAGKKIRVLFMVIDPSGSGNVTFQDSTPTVLLGAMTMGTNDPLVMGENKYGWLETAVGESFDMVMAATNRVGGMVGYVEIG